MEEKFVKAIKAGLIGALLVVIVYWLTDLVFYWALTKPSLQQWAGQQAGGLPQYPQSVSNIPLEGIAAGCAICGGFLLVYVIFLLAGALAARSTAPFVKGAKDMALSGAIAGAVAQAASAPFQILAVALMDLYAPVNPSSLADLGPWLVSSLARDYTVSLAVAIILAVVAALVYQVVIHARDNRDINT